MPEDTVPAAPIQLPAIAADLVLPSPPALMIDAAMQAALNAALAQAQTQLSVYMASFGQSQPSMKSAGADTVSAAGGTLLDPIGPLIVPPPGATLKGAAGLLFDSVPTMMPLDFPILLPASLGGGLNTSLSGIQVTTSIDMIATGAAIDLGDGTWLQFSDMAESNGTEH